MNVRWAVGAVVYCGDQVLLVKKVKINSCKGKIDIEGEWDFPKGGIEPYDTDLKEAILRELYEETSSRSYRVIREYPENISFNFSSEVAAQTGYDSQVTTLFCVEFFGNPAQLKPQDDEIGQLAFVDKTRVLDLLHHGETRCFFAKYGR